MTSRQLVLEILEHHKGSFVSGERIAGNLGITRAAIWRAIDELRKAGYEIESSTKIGYRLVKRSDQLSAEGIGSLLPPQIILPIHYHETIDSTNREAKRLALEGAPQGTLVVARMQTGGRGRLGRTFYSPPDSGIYMSMILRPEMDSSLALRITGAAAVAVCRAIEQHAEVQATIKWVNDIHIGGLKVCGILTEGISGFESGRIESVVVGIGLNYTIPTGGFPEDLQQIATAVFTNHIPPGITRNRMVATIAERLLEVLDQLGSSRLTEEYRSRSAVIDKDVQVMQGNETYMAHVIDIADDGSLLVRMHDGTERLLGSGEISLRTVT